MFDNKYIALGIVILNSFTIGRVYDKLNIVTIDAGIIVGLFIMTITVLTFSYILLTKIK